MPLWQIVDAGLATWDELRTSWTLIDVSKALSYLELKTETQRRMMDAAQAEAEAKAREKAKGKDHG